MSKGATMNGKEMEDDDPIVSESESESEEDEDVKLNEPSKTAINNKAGLLDKHGDISWPENIDWIHKLSIDIEQEQEVDVNDDLTRELAFYTQALEGAREALLKFQSMGLPFLRPSDYYAEMVKSDTHMEKVKGRLLAEKKRTEEADERRKSRENKKLAKEIQVQKQRERAKQKKDEIESVKNWRKQRKQSGFAADDKDADFSLAFEEGKSFERSNKKRPGVGPGDRSGGKAKFGGGGGGKGKKGFDKKRERRDSKFGFGGRKGLKKQNTAETTNDFRAFNKNKFSSNKKQKV
ncbi:hypothetical protein BUALT_Bualt09G0071300 [Buddleja alternifolia]|uniref:rRNA processing protein EBP2 n=1 Tax=Buddleja alternifolia TaxID=168488 RepID=A0AAV6X0N1_9LAMI|nr:hypothetical protein BUALT_Bualt09G0071300 [Buddleja alternifolia]